MVIFCCGFALWPHHFFQTLLSDLRSALRGFCLLCMIRPSWIGAIQSTQHQSSGQPRYCRPIGLKASIPHGVQPAIRFLHAPRPVLFFLEEWDCARIIPLWTRGLWLNGSNAFIGEVLPVNSPGYNRPIAPPSSEGHLTHRDHARSRIYFHCSRRLTLADSALTRVRCGQRV